MGVEYDLYKIDKGESYGLGKGDWPYVFEYGVPFVLRTEQSELEDLIEYDACLFDPPDGYSEAVARDIIAWAGTDRLLLAADNGDLTNAEGQCKLVPDMLFTGPYYKDTGNRYFDRAASEETNAFRADPDGYDPDGWNDDWDDDYEDDSELKDQLSPADRSKLELALELALKEVAAMTPLSPEEQRRRRPPPPALLLDALQDRPQTQETSRPERTVRLEKPARTPVTFQDQSSADLQARLDKLTHTLRVCEEWNAAVGALIEERGLVASELRRRGVLDN